MTSELDLENHMRDVHGNERNLHCTLSKFDHSSLDDRGWLTDSVIWEYISLQTNENKYDKKLFAVIPPSICEKLKLCNSETENNILMADMEITEKQFVIMFINDAKESGGGSHWSSMIYIKEKKLFHHTDTIKNGNKEHALLLSKQVSTTLNIKNYQFSNCDDNLQDNSYDCGVYTIVHTILALEYFVKRGKRYAGFCTFHNKSSIQGLREKILNDLCKCTYVTSFESELNIRKHLPKPLHHEEQSKDYAQDCYDVSKWQSTTCKKYKKSNKCDFCSHVIETDNFFNKHEKKRNRVHGHLRHDYAPMNKIRWFVYVIIDIHCEKYYVGSTVNPVFRWANHKKETSAKTKEKCTTALSRHFVVGCPGDINRNKSHLKIILVDHYDVTKEQLCISNHKDGAGCKCEHCILLKTIEVKWMVITNSTSETYGLNSMDEVTFITRGTHRIL